MVSFHCKVPLWCVLTEEWQLRGIETSSIFSLFGGRLDLWHVRDRNRGCVWRKLCLNSVAERTHKCGKENREWRWRQIKPIYRWHLYLLVKLLRSINCLNAWANNCATFCNQDLRCYTVFLHKNHDTKNSSGLYFKA